MQKFYLCLTFVLALVTGVFAADDGYVGPGEPPYPPDDPKNCKNYKGGKEPGCPDCPKPLYSFLPIICTNPSSNDSFPQAGTSIGQSVIDNLSFNHIHFAWDLPLLNGSSGGGCAPCGGSSALQGHVPSVFLQRRHRFRDIAEQSSFGPGIFQNYDITLSIMKNGSANRVRMIDPMLTWPMSLDDGLNFRGNGDVKDGIYVDSTGNNIKDLRLTSGRSGTGSLVTDIYLSKGAVLTGHHGVKFYFDVIDLGVQQSAPVPGISDWMQRDVGAVSKPGDASHSGGVFTVQGSGADVWSGDDEFRYVYQALRGDGSLTLRVGSQSNTDSWAKAGILFRESLAFNSRFAAMFVTPGNGSAFQRRTSTGANAIHTAGPAGAAPQWVRLTRTGSTLTGEHSVDGTTWTLVGTETIAFAQDIFVGMAVTAHHDGALSTATFDNLTLSGTQTPANEWPATGVGNLLGGRLTRIEDRNGYAVNLTYKFNPVGHPDTSASQQTDIAISPERQWQINTVKDAHNRQLTFTYNASQVAGRWVVSQITVPNGQSIQYTYSSDKLSQVNHPDGTVSTFTTTVGSNFTQVAYDDASADGTHRRKTVYLTNNFGEQLDGFIDDLPSVWNKASLLVRMVKNGDGEVSYLNISDANNWSRWWVYEGQGKVKELSHGRQVRFLKDGWTFNSGQGYNSFVGTREETFVDEQSMGSGDNYYLGYLRRRPATVVDQFGMSHQYEYNSADLVNKKTFSDGTTEEYSFNDFNQVTRFKDRLNRVTKHEYDARGNKTKTEVGIVFSAGMDVPQPEYAVYLWEYYPAGHANQYLLKTEFDALYNVGQPDLHRADFEYNADQQLVKKIEAADVAGGSRAETTFTYDAFKRLKTVSDPLGRTVTYDYDTRERQVKITYADGSTERFFYGSGSDANLLVKQKDRNGNVTKMEYDLTGRSIKTTSAFSKMDLSDNETPITDVSVKVEENCTYQIGTTLKKTCNRSGELTEYEFDYRHRLSSSTVYPKQGFALTSSNTYSRNLLFSSSDPYGRKSFHNYRNSDSALVRTVRGTVPTYSLADFTAVANVTRDLGNNAPFVVEDIELDAERQTLARIDGRNIRHTMSYDSRGRMFEAIEAESVGGVASADAAKTVYEFDANSNRTRIKHPRTFTEASNFFNEFTYSGRNLLASQTEAAGKPESATMSYVYALDRRLLETTDGRNNVWKQTWKDCCGRIATKVDPFLADGTRPYSYFQQDFHGNTTHVVRLKDFATFANCCMTDPMDIDTFNETTTKFDARHRPVAQTTWLVARGAVDPNDVPIAGDNGVPAADGLTTRWRYDENLSDSQGIDAKYSTQITARLGAGYFGSSATGYAVETTNPAGEKSVSIYDGVGRVVLQIDGNMNSSKSTFDVVVGNLLETSIADGLNHISKSRVDGVGRVRETVDPENKVVTFEYDANGNRVKYRDANGVGQDCFFDDRNRDKRCIDTATPSSETKKTFDAHNNVTVSTDALNKNTVCVFDARDRKISCTDRISGITAFEYDKNNNLTKITDAEGGITSYTYDPRNLLSTETFPAHNKADGHYDIREYTYDAANRLKTRKDQLLAVTTYNYDLANRLLTRAYPDSLNDTFTYDAASRLLSAANARYNNLVTRDYTLGGEAAGRLKRETQTIGGTPYQISYAYDAANRQTSVTYPTGDVVDRTFTDRNQLSAVNFNGNAVASFLHDNGMRRTQTTFGNGVVEDRTYFADNLNNTIKANKGAAKVTDFTYSWDANKRKTAEADGIVPPVNSQTFGYDDEDRLTTFARNNGNTQSWNLSLVGDWNSFTKNGNTETRTHNDAHEIIGTDQGATPEHDFKGNLTKNSNKQEYIWDIENRMATAKVPTGIPDTFYTHTYAYDALGRRVSKTVGTVTTVFVNDGLQEICEYENGAFARSYVFGSYIDEPLRMTSAAGIHYYHANQIYSVAALTDSAGGVVERYTYSPYGQVTVLNGAGAVTGFASAYGNPWTFTGRRLDSETGLMYYRARMYSTELGRFVGRDPLAFLMMLAPKIFGEQYLKLFKDEFLKSSNFMDLYFYSKHSPQAYVDPTGLKFSISITARNERKEEDFADTCFCGKVKGFVGIDANPNKGIGGNYKDYTETPDDFMGAVLEAIYSSFRCCCKNVEWKSWVKGVSLPYFPGKWEDDHPVQIKVPGAASFNDYPGPTGWINTWTEYRDSFKTQAICKDSGAPDLVLYTIYWEYKVWGRQWGGLGIVKADGDCDDW